MKGVRLNYSGRFKVLMSRPYIDSKEAVELVGQLIDYHEFTPEDLCLALAKHGALVTYYKGNLLENPNYQVVTKTQRRLISFGNASPAPEVPPDIFVTHYDEADTESFEPVYFLPEHVKYLADIINGTEKTEAEAAEAEQLRQRIAELEAEKAGLPNTDKPLHPSERRSVSQIVAVLASLAGLDVAKPYAAAEPMRAHAAKEGVELPASDETIKKFFQWAEDASSK